VRRLPLATPRGRVPKAPGVTTLRASYPCGDAAWVPIDRDGILCRTVDGLFEVHGDQEQALLLLEHRVIWSGSLRLCLDFANRMREQLARHGRSA
jgi:hypothetical protein